MNKSTHFFVIWDERCNFVAKYYNNEREYIQDI